MAANYAVAPEVDSGAESVTSTPRSARAPVGGTDDHHLQPPRVRLMCSFGGKILPRPHDNQLRYVGGDTRIVAVSRSTSFASLVGKLSKLTGAAAGEFIVKYQLPNEDLDALITVSTDEDLENMMEEWERLTAFQQNKNVRLRVFLFPNTGSEGSRASSISSLLDGSTKRESWFLDALNGGRAVSGDYDRNRSEASSIVSEVPDYLFGLENSGDPAQARSKMKKTKSVLSDNIPGSDPGSPSPFATASSPFGSSSSAPACVPTSPNLKLPPVKTKPESPVVGKAPETPIDVLSEPGSAVNRRTEPVQQGAAGFEGFSSVWSHPQVPHPGHGPVQPMPVYYVAAPGHNPGPVQISHGPGQGQPMQVPSPYFQHYQMPPGQYPIGYQPVQIPGTAQIPGGPVRPPMTTMGQYVDAQGRVVQGGLGQIQPTFYGGGGGAYLGQPEMAMPAGGEMSSAAVNEGGRVGPV